MKVYKIHLDEWYGYTGLFSSIEKACEILPECPSFKKALSFALPSFSVKGNKEYSPNWQINKNIKAVLKKDHNFLNIYLPGFTIDVTEIIHTPEIKEEGKHYIAAKTERRKLDSIVTDEVYDIMAVAKIEEIELDVIKEL